MASKAMVWDATGQKFYETGVSKGGLYLQDETGAYSKGVAWNGLSSVAENPSGGEETKIYADNQKYLSLYSAEDFGATVECYTTPDEFDACDGKKTIAKGVTIRQQDRKTFGMTYQTILGNDTKKDEYDTRSILSMEQWQSHHPRLTHQQMRVQRHQPCHTSFRQLLLL